LLVLFASLLLVTTAAAAATPEQQCQSGKNKAAGKYAGCRLNAEAKLATSGDATKYADALAKCSDKLATAWQKLEAKAAAAGASCPSVGDASDIDGKTTASTTTVARLVAGTRFEDNGDGTVTDHRTGLQWEKKQNLAGVTNAADPHDADNLYAWTAGGGDNTLPDGPAFTDFLVALNGRSADGTTLIGCFAGHCDWRLPTVVELQTILLAPYVCSTLPCIAPVFGPTIAESNSMGYWSTTVMDEAPGNAWYVAFFGGLLAGDGMLDENAVRAVRGGY
jgi:hypothetical protein